MGKRKEMFMLVLRESVYSDGLYGGHGAGGGMGRTPGMLRTYKGDFLRV